MQPWIVSGAETHGDIDIVGNEIHPTVFRRDPYVDIRMQRPEPRKSGDQPFHGKGRHDTDGERTTDRDPTKLGQRHGYPPEGIRDRGRQPHAFLDQRDRSSEAMKQPAFQPVLEKADLLADRRRRNIQLLGGFSEAQMPSRRLEGAQGVQRR